MEKYREMLRGVAPTAYKLWMELDMDYGNQNEDAFLDFITTTEDKLRKSLTLMDAQAVVNVMGKDYWEKEYSSITFSMLSVYSLDFLVKVFVRTMNLYGKKAS